TSARAKATSAASAWLTWCSRRSRRRGTASTPPRLDRAERASYPIRTSLVGDAGAGWPSERKHFEGLEADVLAPAAKVGASEVEGVAEFDEHVQAHHQAEDVLSAVVVDEVLNHDEGAAGGQCLERRPDELELSFQVPVVED